MYQKFSAIVNLSLPEREDFYSHLNLNDISDADYAHAKRVCKDLGLKKFMRIS